MEKFINKLDTIFKGRAIKPTECLSPPNNSPEILFEDCEKEGKTKFVTQEVDEEYANNKCFKVINPEQTEVFLWAIDNCFVVKGKIFSQTYPRRCDCAFGYGNYIGFVEFKTNANPSASHKTIANNIEDAIEQITHTICFLKDSLKLEKLKIEGYTIEAYLCTQAQYPTKKTDFSDWAIQFLETHDIRLFAKNEKSIPNATE